MDRHMERQTRRVDVRVILYTPNIVCRGLINENYANFRRCIDKKSFLLMFAYFLQLILAISTLLCSRRTLF